MPQITLEQALFLRPDGGSPQRLAQSAGFNDAWLHEAEYLILAFGDRPAGIRCPPTVFAKPLLDKHVAVVRVVDEFGGVPIPTGGIGYVPGGLFFHFLVVEQREYEAWIRDPFMLADKIAPTWHAEGSLPSLMILPEAFSLRTVVQVQAVLKRIKAAALQEGEDPESPDFQRTIENSESPALLGGAQVLVDGGRLIFERPAGDLQMVSGLWLLLPEATRSRLWPTSFAFSADLHFDVLVVPLVKETMLEDYTTEEQAADYPEGTYELALQRAVEAEDQAELDAVFRRRDSRQTIRLAIILLIVLSLIVLLSRWLG